LEKNTNTSDIHRQCYLDDAQIESVIEKSKGCHVKNAATPARWKMGPKRLAYTVDTKNNGFYAFFEFKGPAT